MSFREEVDKDFEYSVVKADAGCTPKLSRRKSVGNDCGGNVTRVSSKRTPRSSRRSNGSASWLCAVKRSSVTTKKAVENRKKVCTPLQFDTAPFSKMVQYSGCYPSADSMHMVICGNKSEAASLYCENKTTSSRALVKVLDCVHVIRVFNVFV